MPRAFWSGTITFGLVSVPVELYAGQRSRPVSLRMLTPDGRPVQRRYWCPAHERYLEPDEIVRGHEVEDGAFVRVTDDELEALAPDKSREIDLRQFVDRADLPTMLFDRGYFLVPRGDTTKAYRLLAEVMERTGRAGLATFVMRGKEYVVAILAEGGILRAETLRFNDELRSPEDVGLPDLAAPDAAEVRRMTEAIEAAAAEGLDRAELEDEWAVRVRALADEKLEAGRDVVRVAEAGEEGEPAGAGEDEEDDEDIIDLMEFLRRRLAGGGDGGASGDADADGGGRSGGGDGPLEDMTKKELYDLARRKEIEGRSSMTKEELVKALRRTG